MPLFVLSYSGIFIVHKSIPTLTEWPLFVSDWYHLEGYTIEIVNPSSVEPEDKGDGDSMFADRKLRDYAVDNTPIAGTIWIAGLINGRGRFKNAPYPLTKFHVEHGQTYKFRMINVGAEYPLRVSIDSHPLRIIALDGFDVVPFEVDFILISTGERVDFEMTANQIEGRYWLRAESPQDPKKTIPGHDVKASVVYRGISANIDPTSSPRSCTRTSKCRIFNCPFRAYPTSYHRVCIHLTDVKSKQDAKLTATEYGLHDTDIQEVFFNIGFHSVGTSINAKKFMPPTAPLFQKDAVEISCTEACKDKTKGCICTNEVELQFNKTIQVVISNIEPIWKNSPHPMHVHGHSFAVVKMGFATQNQTTGHYIGFNPDILCSDDGTLCLTTHWNAGAAPSVTSAALSSPPIKDTVWLPSRGYVVLRFRANNPGYWLMHCHMNHHIDSGMVALFNEAPGFYPPPPEDFPTCFSYVMNKQEYDAYKIIYNKYINGPGNLGHLIGDSITAPSSTKPKAKLPTARHGVCLPSGQ